MAENKTTTSPDLISEEDEYDEIYEEDMLSRDQMAPYFYCLESHQYAGVGEEEEEDNMYLIDAQGDVIYEEIVLLRSAMSQRLGLTLCYQHDDTDQEDAIFINEIEKNSLAGICKRIQIGDQIIQINGKNVRSRSEAMNEFAKQNLQVTMLLARSANIKLKCMADFIEDEKNLESGIRPLPKNIFQRNRIINRTCGNLSPLPEQSMSLEIDVEEDHLTDNHSNNSALDKDSGMSRGTDSDPDIYAMPFELNACPNNNFAPVVPPSISSIPTKRCTMKNNSISNASNFEECLEKELQNLHLEMEIIQDECDKLVDRSATKVAQIQHNQKMVYSKQPANFITDSPSLHRKGPAPPKRLDNCVGHFSLPNSPLLAPKTTNHTKFFNPSNIIEENSSAYNTGNESCRSTPNKTDTPCILNPRSPPLSSANNTLTAGASATTFKPSQFMMSPKMTHSLHKTKPIQPHDYYNQDDGKINIPVQIDPVEENTYHTVKAHCKFRLPKYSIKNQTITSKYPKSSRKSKEESYKPGDITYTRPEDLAKTIKKQQQALIKAMEKQAMSGKSVSLPSSPQVSNNRACDKFIKPCLSNVKDLQPVLIDAPVLISDEAPNYEWKVKRRSDGTRYIIRRQLRSHQIRANREKQLKEERIAVSTDDDAVSDLKVGKFWTREERKKHLERAKAHKARQHQKMLESERAVPDQLIMQLSNRKMMKRKGQQLLDNYVTLQEFLAHGSKDSRCPVIEGVLSVTTV
uniref:PDZ domain-containing protein n=1 Tax=Rhabditophanes sp. KR3021 TaxID=114890 RepID=A0AC35U8P9_9BILA